MSPILNLSKHRKSYKNMFKRFVVRYYERMAVKSKNRVSKVFGLSRSTVREYVNIKDTLLNRKCPLARRHQISNDKNKKAPNYDVELELHQWFLDQRLKDIVMTPLLVKNKMMNLMNDKHPDVSPIWKLSRGLLRNFMRRYDLSYRRITTSGRELPKDCVPIILNFLEDVKNKIDKIGKYLYKFEFRHYFLNLSIVKVIL